METKVEEAVSNDVSGQLNALAGLISPEEAGKFIKPKETEPPKEQPRQPEATNTPQTPAEPQKETPKVDENLDKLKNSSLFSDVFAQTPKAETTLSDWEQTAKYISENAGLEVKDYSDVQKLVNEFKQIKEQTVKLPDLEKKASFYEEIYTNLPDDLYEAVETYLEGNDYKAKLKERYSAEKLDVSIPFKKQDKKEVLDYFFPGKFSEEDYEEENNKAIEIAYEQAEKMFNEYKTKHATTTNTYKEKKTKEQIEIAEKLKESAIQSFNRLGANVTVEQKKKIGSILSGGKEAVMDLFLTKEGSFKENAAEVIHDILYAKEQIDLVKAYLSNQIKSQANEDIVTRMNDRPNSTGGSSTISKAEQQKRAEDFVEQMMGFPTKR